MKKVKIGDIVLYNVPENTQDSLSQLGNNKNAKLPAIVTAVWSETCINAKVIVDGNTNDLWKTSISKGDQPHNWDFKQEDEV